MKIYDKKLKSIIRASFEEKCEFMIKQLREEVNHGENKCERYIMKLFVFIMDSKGDERTILMIFPQSLPENNIHKQIICKNIGNELYEKLKNQNEKDGTSYEIYSIFCASEVWAAIYDHLPNSSDLLPSERIDRKEFFVITGQDIFKNKFLCQIELKRYKDHILAGNEINRELLWNNDGPFDNKMRNHILDNIFQGYAQAYVKDNED